MVSVRPRSFLELDSPLDRGGVGYPEEEVRGSLLRRGRDGSNTVVSGADIFVLEARRKLTQIHRLFLV